MNAEDPPTEEDGLNIYTDIEITDDLLVMRNEYQLNLKNKNDQIRLFV
jgi:hypothetical protein